MAEARALQLKTDGNKCFSSGNLSEAESLYSQAILITPSNPLLWTNRAMTRLKTNDYHGVVLDCEESLRLLESNMKAQYLMAQAQLELGLKTKALKSAQAAYELCKNGEERWRRDMPNTGALILRCKKEVWEAKETERLAVTDKLTADVEEALILKMNSDIEKVVRRQFDGEFDSQEAKRLADALERDCKSKCAAARKALERAAEAQGAEKRREVPNYIIDDITFSVMHDPVVTKTGNSYERAAIMEHLRRSATDPLTREPLRPEELRPNLALREICDDFLKENGWAVDW